MNNHGDNQCMSNEGGIKCLYRTATPGHAFILSPNLGIISEFNDVRPVESDTLETFIYFGFSQPKAEMPKQVLQLQLWASDPQLVIGSYRGGALPIRTYQESVIWSSGMAFGVSKVIESYPHCHASHLLEALLFQAHPSQLWSNIGIKRDSITYGDRVFFTLLQSISPGWKPVCRYFNNNQELDPQTGNSYFRKSKCNIQPNNQNQLVWTIIAGFERWPKSPTPPPTFLHHVFYRVYYTSSLSDIMVPIPPSDAFLMKKWGDNWLGAQSSSSSFTTGEMLVKLHIPKSFFSFLYTCLLRTGIDVAYVPLAAPRRISFTYIQTIFRTVYALCN